MPVAMCMQRDQSPCRRNYSIIIVTTYEPVWNRHATSATVAHLRTQYQQSCTVASEDPSDTSSPSARNYFSNHDYTICVIRSRDLRDRPQMIIYFRQLDEVPATIYAERLRRSRPAHSPAGLAFIAAHDDF